MTFERLLLPFSRGGGVTHVGGMVVFGGETDSAGDSGAAGSRTGLASPVQAE